MANRNLVIAAKSAIEKGFSIKDVKEGLVRKGYDTETINDVIAEVAVSQNSSSSGAKSHHSIWTTRIAALAVAAVFIIFAIYATTHFDFSSKLGSKVSLQDAMGQSGNAAVKQQVAQQKQEETARNLERASGTLKDLGSTF